jgi:hypothetical protein
MHPDDSQLNAVDIVSKFMGFCFLAFLAGFFFAHGALWAGIQK